MEELSKEELEKKNKEYLKQIQEAIRALQQGEEVVNGLRGLLEALVESNNKLMSYNRDLKSVFVKHEIYFTILVVIYLVLFYRILGF